MVERDGNMVTEREKELEALLSECRIMLALYDLTQPGAAGGLVNKITAALSKPNSEVA